MDINAVGGPENPFAELGNLRAELDAASTLPADWYTRDDVYFRETREIFRKTWQYVTHVSKLKKVGDFVTATIADTPVVVVRADDNTLRAYLNICRHRWAEVAKGEGNTRLLRCPYHAWAYSLDGCLRAAPDSAQEANFDKSKLGLIPLRVDVWASLIFVNFDADAAPIETFVGAGQADIERLGLDLDNYVPGKVTEFTMHANWKIAAENYLECYHCPVSHPEFTAVYDTTKEGYLLEVSDYSLVSRSPVRPHRTPGVRYAPEANAAIGDSLYILLWPNVALNFFSGHGNIVVYSIRPVSPAKTIGSFEYYFAPGTPQEFQTALQDFWDRVGFEDVALIESAHRGLSSGTVPRGRLVMCRETLVHAFQTLTVDHLQEKKRSRQVPIAAE
jgi:choline monooxygenase